MTRISKPRISQRIGAIAESATLAVDAKAKALKAQGENVIGFGAGEPDFPTPEHIVEAAVAACRDPKNHHYTPAAGLPELREAIAAKTKRDSGFECAAANVLVTNGGKHAVFTAFAVLCDPGDEVICPAPYWTTYPEADHARRGRAGGHPTRTRTPASGSPSSSSRPPAPRAPRSLLFVSPDNPSGAVYPPEEVEAIGRWAVDHGIWVVTDEIYEHLMYGDQRVHLDADARARARRHLHHRQRRGQDVRHDRLARRLDDRAEGRHRRRRPTSSPTPPRTSPTCPSAPRSAAVSGDLEAVAMMRDGVRAPRPDHAPDAQRDPRRDLPRAAGRVLLLPVLRRAARPGDRRAPRRLDAGARRRDPQRGQGRLRAGRGVRQPGLHAALVRPRRRGPRRGRGAAAGAASPDGPHPRHRRDRRGRPRRAARRPGTRSTSSSTSTPEGLLDADRRAPTR